MKGQPSKSLLVVLVLLALVVPLVWTKVIASLPGEWAAVHVGMEQGEIHRNIGAPNSGNFQEQQREEWNRNSVLVFRRLVVWYTGSAHPTRATEVVVDSYWHLGRDTVDRWEKRPDK